MARSQNYSTRKGVDSIADRLKNDLLSRIISILQMPRLIERCQRLSIILNVKRILSI